MKEERATPERRLRELVTGLSITLHGHDSETQGAALAELVAIWLAGHHPDLRAEVRKLWLGLADNLLPIIEQEVLENAGVKSWDDLARRDN